MLNRRTLLAGGAAALAAPSLIRPLQARTRQPVVARVVTGFDCSTSTVWTPEVRKPNLTAFAQVMENAMPGIIQESSFDQLDFEVFGWLGTLNYPMVQRTQLIRGNCTSACQGIAAALYRQADEDTKGETRLLPALIAGIQLCSTPQAASKRVFNFVTDDSSIRINPQLDLRAERDNAAARGITINGLIMGDPNAMNRYVEKDIKTPDGFVRRTDDYASIYEAWRNKFILDLG